MHALKTIWTVIVFRLSRRRRWEREVCQALRIAKSAAGKLHVEMERGTVEPKAEYDWLLSIRYRLFNLCKGPYAYQNEHKLSEQINMMGQCPTKPSLFQETLKK